MNRSAYRSMCILLILSVGCGPFPKIRENHKNLPPWEKLPAGNGITYLEKFTDDPGMEPHYLAKIKYDDVVALLRLITTFGLITHTSPEAPRSWAGKLAKGAPIWFPLDKVTKIFIFPDNPHQYVANLWVNEDEQVMILERSWW
jgi:hypothetical protein